MNDLRAGNVQVYWTKILMVGIIDINPVIPSESVSSKTTNQFFGNSLGAGFSKSYTSGCHRGTIAAFPEICHRTSCSRVIFALSVMVNGQAAAQVFGVAEVVTLVTANGAAVVPTLIVT